MSATQAAQKARKSQAKADSGKKKNKSTKVVVATEAEAREAIRQAEKVIKRAKKELAREKAKQAEAEVEAAKAAKEAEKAEAKARKEAKKAQAKADRKRREYRRAKSRHAAMRKMKGPRWIRRLRWEARRAWAKAKRAWRKAWAKSKKAASKAKAAAAFAAGWAAKTAWPTAKTWVLRYSVPAWAWTKTTAVSAWVWSAPFRAWAAFGLGSVAGLALFGAQIAFAAVIAGAVLVFLARTGRGKRYLGRVTKDLEKSNARMKAELKTIESAKKQLEAAKADLKTVVAETNVVKAETEVKDVVPSGPNMEAVVIHDIHGNAHVEVLPEEGTEPDGADLEMERQDNAIALNSAQEQALGERIPRIQERLQSFEQNDNKDGVSEYAGRLFVAMQRLIGNGYSKTRLIELAREHYDEEFGPRDASEKFNWTAMHKGIREEVKLIDQLLEDNKNKSARKQPANA